MLIVGVLAGVVAGIGLATLAGARRTDTLFDRHLDASDASDLEIDPGRPTPEADRALRSMPEVAEASYWAVVSAFILDDEGRIDADSPTPLTFTTDGRYLDQDRLAVHEGRLLDPIATGRGDGQRVRRRGSRGSRSARNSIWGSYLPTRTVLHSRTRRASR